MVVKGKTVDKRLLSQEDVVWFYFIWESKTGDKAIWLKSGRGNKHFFLFFRTVFFLFRRDKKYPGVPAMASRSLC